MTLTDTTESVKEKEFKRKDDQPPAAIAEYGWRYHHIGIPVDKPVEGETYIEQLKIHVAGFENSPYGIQFMRFDHDCGQPEIILKLPHVAFEVDDLDEAVKDKNILTPINSPSAGVRVAMIIDNGAPIELIEFTRADNE